MAFCGLSEANIATLEDDSFRRRQVRDGRRLDSTEPFTTYPQSIASVTDIPSYDELTRSRTTGGTAPAILAAAAAIVKDVSMTPADTTAGQTADTQGEWAVLLGNDMPRMNDEPQDSPPSA